MSVALVSDHEVSTPSARKTGHLQVVASNDLPPPAPSRRSSPAFAAQPSHLATTKGPVTDFWAQRHSPDNTQH